MIPNNYLLVYSDKSSSSKIYAIFSEKLGNFVLNKDCRVTECNCLGCSLFEANIQTIQGRSFPVLDVQNKKKIQENLVGYPFTEYGDFLVESLKPRKYKKYGGRITKEVLDNLFKEPVAFIQVVTEDDKSFTHYYIDPDRGKKKISIGCYSESCQCIACRMLETVYIDFNGNPKKIIDVEKAKIDLDGNLLLPIYYQKDLITKFLCNSSQVNSDFLIDNFDSPLERLFYKLACLDLRLMPQHPVGKYRLDFSIPDKMIAIELDGHDYHKTVDQRTHDAQRDRWLSKQGWTVLRFTGKEVFHNPGKCIDEICAYINIERVSKLDFEEF